MKRVAEIQLGEGQCAETEHPDTEGAEIGPVESPGPGIYACQRDPDSIPYSVETLNLSTQSLHSVIERIASVFRSSLREVASAHGLKLVQLEALIYFATANRYSDTAGALAEYLGLTKGTISQTLKTLEGRELLTKHADDDDARIVHCKLSPEAQAIVKEAYPVPLLDEFDETLGKELTLKLRRLLYALQHANGMQTFGECQTCRFFKPRTQGGFCNLTKESLSNGDKRKLCREHEPKQRSLPS